MNIGIKHLKLSNNCLLKDWDVSLLLNLKSIEIGDNYLGLINTLHWSYKTAIIILFNIYWCSALRFTNYCPNNPCIVS